MATWRKGTNPGHLTAGLTRAQSTPGSSTFTGGTYQELLVLLGGAVELNPEIPETDRRRLLNQAVGAAAKSNSLTADGLLRHITRKESEYLAQPISDFRLVSGISVAPRIALPRCQLAAARISFGVTSTRAVVRAREKILHDARHWLFGNLPQGYSQVSVAVRARSPHAAGAKALDALDFVRSVWNLSLNRGQSWRWSSGRHKPVNQIFLHPIHSLHNKNGSLATDAWWYDPQHVDPAPPMTDRAKVERFVNFLRKVRMHLQKLHYADAWQTALLRYGRALDSRDLNDAFLRLWSVLEYLTDSTSSPAAVTIRRSAFTFADREHSHMVLTQLAAYRNRFVHMGSESEEIESLLYQLKRHVEALLIFHLGFKFRFSSIGHACEFLDLPSSQATLSKKIELLQLARDYVVSP